MSSTVKVLAVAAATLCAATTATESVTGVGVADPLREVLREKLQLGRPEPVSEVNVSSYVGRWYQMYTNEVVMKTFEKTAVCDTADYHVLTNGSIGLSNGDYNIEQDVLMHIDGYATVPDSKQPGKLLVRFTDGHADPFPAPYWIMALGPLVENPVNGKDEYAYSIVADSLVPLGTLFVLARDVDDFRTKYDSDVQQQLDALGFKEFFNKPLETVQGGNCSYLPVVPGST